MEPLVLVCFLAAFIGMWFFVTRHLRRMAGMAKGLDVDTGILARESSWGSGRVNGVGARSCLKISEYQNGWVVRMMSFFGGCKLWLPKDRADGGEIQKGGFLSLRSCTIVCEEDHVRLFGCLADFIVESNATPESSPR